jgi:hypothetical protein
VTGATAAGARNSSGSSTISNAAFVHPWSSSSAPVREHQQQTLNSTFVHFDLVVLCISGREYKLAREIHRATEMRRRSSEDRRGGDCSINLQSVETLCSVGRMQGTNTVATDRTGREWSGRTCVSCGCLCVTC